MSKTDKTVKQKAPEKEKITKKEKSKSSASIEAAGAVMTGTGEAAVNKKKFFKLSLVQKQNFAAYGFLLLWLLGFFQFFVIPVADSFIYSVSDVSITAEGITSTYQGFKNFNKALRIDPDFIKKLAGSLGTLAYEVPVITIFSLFIAIMIKPEFRGRTFARVIFFLPVIIATGVIIDILSINENSSGEALFRVGMSVGDNVFSVAIGSLSSMLEGLGINATIVDYLQNAVNQIFDITWKSGIQILLFLAGLQTIPSSYYEVSSIEGATAWDAFWKITFPIISPITRVCIVYTIIDSCITPRNELMRFIKEVYDKTDYAFASAMYWIFFACIFLIVIVVSEIILKRFVVYAQE